MTLVFGKEVLRRMAQSIAGFDSPALASESAYPGKPNGDRLRIYGMRFCPFTERALLTISAKKIPAEVVNINLRSKPSWFLDRNPLGGAPTLEWGDRVVFDSLLVAEFIDESFRTPKFLPEDPYLKAQEKMRLERLGIPKLNGVLHSFFRNREDEEAIQGIKELLAKIQELLTEDYFSGKQAGWTDYMSWPFLERCCVVETVGKLNMGAEFPKLQTYMQRMLARPEVKENFREANLHLRFIKSMFDDNKPNFDIT